MIKIYLFDLDDTLVDAKIYAELYVPICNTIKKKLNITDKELDQKAEELGLKKNKYNRWDTGDLCRELGLLEVYYKILEEHIRVKQVLHDKVEAIFEELKKRGKIIGIVSNSMHRTIAAYVHKYGLQKYIDLIFSSDDAGCLKHDKKFWKTFIEKEKLKPEECLMIGDDLEEDIKIPKGFGFQTHYVENSKDLDSVLNI